MVVVLIFEKPKQSTNVCIIMPLYPIFGLFGKKGEREKQNQYFFTFKIQSEMIDVLRECCIWMCVSDTRA
jgi:hypothetical protein